MKDNSKMTAKQKDLQTIKRFKDLNLIDSDVSKELEESLDDIFEEKYREEYLNTRQVFSETLESLPNKAEILDKANQALQQRLENNLRFQIGVNDSVINNLISERKAKGLPVTFSKKEIMDSFK